jgi:hypothetical protein
VRPGAFLAGAGLTEAMRLSSAEAWDYPIPPACGYQRQDPTLSSTFSLPHCNKPNPVRRQALASRRTSSAIRATCSWPDQLTGEAKRASGCTDGRREGLQGEW